MRVFAYIDGLNLYYRLLKGVSGSRWLNPEALIQHLFEDSEVAKIRYFTAVFNSVDGDQGKRQRQHFFLRALRTLPNLELHKARIHRAPTWKRLVEGDGSQKAHVWVDQEKGSDAGLAAYLIRDAALEEYDKAVVVTSDTDQAESIEVARSDFGKDVVLRCPQKDIPRALTKVCPDAEIIWQTTVRKCQFPDTLSDDHGQFHCPPAWRSGG